MIWGSSQTNPNYANYRPMQSTGNYAGPVAPGASTAVFRATGGTVYNTPYNTPKPTVLGASYSGGGIPSVSNPNPSTPQQNNPQPQYDALKAQEDAINQQLESDYNQAMNALSGQESGLQAQAGTAMGSIGNEAAATKTALGAEQATKEQGVNTSLSTAETGAKSSLQQARDLFRQTQQQNIAQMSALGISSSSVSEALAERLGVETARRIAGVTGSLQEVRTNAANELGRIKNYFAERSTQIQQQAEAQKAQIQQALVQGLNQINSARQAAASDKAARRQSLLSQVSSSIAQLTQQEQQFQQSLKAWAAQKSAALTPIAQDPNYVQNLLAQTQNIQQQFNPSQFVATPSFNFDKLGDVTGQINLQKPPKEEEDLLTKYLQ